MIPTTFLSQPTYTPSFTWAGEVILLTEIELVMWQDEEGDIVSSDDDDRDLAPFDAAEYWMVVLYDGRQLEVYQAELDPGSYQELHEYVFPS